MRFQDIRVFRQDRFSVGKDTQQNMYYLSIPVSSGIVDYDEYYTIPSEWATASDQHQRDLDNFAEECRHQKHDDLLILKPGTNRGVAV